MGRLPFLAGRELSQAQARMQEQCRQSTNSRSMKPEQARVLALMPHPDDCEFLCAGALLRLGALGAEIHVATMTAGDKGSTRLSAAQIAAVRRQEARAAAQVLGAASCRCLELRDLEISFDLPTRRRVAALLRSVGPSVVFTTPPSDYMADHETTSRLVRDACFNAAVPGYQTGLPDTPLAEIPWLYYTDALGGQDIFGMPATVDTLVDISSVMDRKLLALERHASQREWLRERHGMDEYVESSRRWAALRGAQAGVGYAEGFRQHRGHPHRPDNLLAQWLGAVEL